MRILSWNINGLNSHKVDMHDTIQYIETFDVALLTETRSASYEVFQSYQHFSLPVTDSGRAGQRVCVLVHPRFQPVEVAA